MTKLGFLTLAAIILCTARAFAQEPANPKANAKARAVLKYMQALESRADKRLVSGQFAAFGNGASLKLLQSVHEKTGHWPGLIGVDYADFGRGGLTWDAPNKSAIEYWKRGGVVTVSAHLYNPANPKGGGLRDKGVDIATLLATNSEAHTRCMIELDQIAAGLDELK